MTGLDDQGGSVGDDHAAQSGMCLSLVNPTPWKDPL